MNMALQRLEEVQHSPQYLEFVQLVASLPRRERRLLRKEHRQALLAFGFPKGFTLTIRCNGEIICKI